MSIELNPFQVRAIDHVCQHPRSMLWLPRSAGKTLVYLYAINHLLKHGAIRGALVLGPIRTLQSTWPEAIESEPRLAALKIADLTGGRSKNVRVRELMRSDANVWVCNLEQLHWLTAELYRRFLHQGRPLPFDFLAIDEISRLKNARTKQGSTRAQYLQMFINQFPWRTGGTGSPAAKGIHGVFGQFLILDDGHRLGTSYALFKQTHFRDKSRDPRFERLEIMPTHREQIINKVADITFQITPEEYAEMNLPPYNWVDTWIDLPPKLQQQYDHLEKQLFTLLDSGTKVSAPQSVTLNNLLRQFANGAMYREPGNRSAGWEEIHALKLDHLGDIVESLQGKPLLVAYQYRPDLDRILKKFKGKVTVFGGRAMSGSEVRAINAAWNEGRIQILAGHHDSIGHGLNLQYGGSAICWVGCTYNTEGFEQFNSRLQRRNQSAPQVDVYRLLVRNTIDEAVILRLYLDIMEQDRVSDTMDAALKRYKRQKEQSWRSTSRASPPSAGQLVAS